MKENVYYEIQYHYGISIMITFLIKILKLKCTIAMFFYLLANEIMANPWQMQAILKKSKVDSGAICQSNYEIKSKSSW